MSTEIISATDEQALTVGLRIRHIRKSLKMTQKRFAGSLGIVQGFLSAIEKGRKTPSDTLLIALQHLYKVNPDWIHSGQGENTLSSRYYTTAQSENSAVIPLLNELPNDKEGFQQSTEFDRYISLPGIPTNSFAFVYNGDYMSPTIRDGDIIIINTDKALTSGAIALIVGKWGEPILRRYREIDGDPYFSSDNTAYAPFRPNASTKTLGVVLKVWREIKI